MPKEIRIDGVIGNGPNEISAKLIRSQLPANGTDEIVVKIHSEGGSVFEGFTIYDVLAQYQGPKRAVIESSAFSIASFIAMAFDDVEISPNGYMMLHNPSVGVEGDDEELAKSSSLLGQLKTNMVEAYSKRTGKSPDEVLAILKAETYYNATNAVAAGLVDRIAEKPVIGRAFARLETLPHGVVAALFGAGSGGDNRDTTRETPLSETQVPVAASISDIEKAFPKAKAEFVLKCVRQQMPMASVAAAAAEEMMEENARLTAQVEEMTAKISAMEEESAKAKAEGEEEEAPVEEEAKAKAEEEKEAEAKARRLGARPVAQARASKPSASAQWNQAIQAHVAAGLPKAKAVSKANKENPGLREQMLAEVNG